MTTIKTTAQGSDDSSDDDDDPNATPPAWASNKRLNDQVMKQQYLDADIIFKGPVEPIDLEDIFSAT